MWKTLCKIRLLLTPRDKFKLLGLVTLMALSALGEMLGIGLLIGVIVTFLEPAFKENPLILNYKEFIGLDWLHFFVLNVFLIGIFLALKNLFSLWVVHRQSQFIYRKQSEFCTRLFCNYLNAPYEESIKHSCAERMSNLARTFQLCEGVTLPLSQLTADILVIAVLSAGLLFFLPWITIGGIVFMLITTGGLHFFLTRLNKSTGEKYFKGRRILEQYQHTGFTGIKTIKACHKESFFCSQYEKEQEQIIHSASLLFTFGQIPRLLLESAALLLLCIIFALLSFLGVSEQTILLDFSMIVAVMARMLPAVSRCNYNLTIIKQNMYTLDTITAELTQTLAENLGNGSGHLTLERDFKIENLTFAYENGQPVFENFNLEIPARSSLGISGKTGRGKTTFIDLLLGLFRPQQGNVYADGVSVYDNLHQWRKMIGYVSQDIFIAEGISIAGNIALGVPENQIDREKVWETLQLAQLDQWVDALPEKENSILSAAGGNISGGQRQRIAIARALYSSPKLLLLDEATSALDNETEKAFVEALDILKGKITMIVVAHRLSTIEKCDKILEL